MGRQGVWPKVRGCFCCRCCLTDLFDGARFSLFIWALMPATSLLMASTNLFNSKMCCSAGPSPRSSISPLSGLVVAAPHAHVRVWSPLRRRVEFALILSITTNTTACPMDGKVGSTCGIVCQIGQWFFLLFVHRSPPHDPPSRVPPSPRTRVRIT